MTLASNVLFLYLNIIMFSRCFFVFELQEITSQKNAYANQKKKTFTTSRIEFSQKKLIGLFVSSPTDAYIAMYSGNSIKLTRSHLKLYLKGLAKLMYSGARTRFRYIEVLSFPHEIFYYNSAEKNSGW